LLRPRKKERKGRKEARKEGTKEALWVAKLLGAYQPQESFFSSLPLNL
jgi:hypothetical protein